MMLRAVVLVFVYTVTSVHVATCPTLTLSDNTLDAGIVVTWTSPPYFGREGNMLVLPRVQLPFHMRLSRYVDWSTLSLDLSDTPRVKIDPEFDMNPHLLGKSSIVKRTISWLWTEQIAEVKNLLRMIESKEYFKIRKRISNEVLVINQTINSARAYGSANRVGSLQQERANYMKVLELIDNGNYGEPYRLLRLKLDNLHTTKETKDEFILTILEQISPQELARAIANAVQQQQRAARLQMEKIERLQKIKEEEGAPILIRRRQETEDERQEEFHLLLMLLALWFLLCYCSDGTVWCVDVELTFGLSLVLSKIILLLGGDIEKNPGPLTGIFLYLPE